MPTSFSQWWWIMVDADRAALARLLPEPATAIQLVEISALRSFACLQAKAPAEMIFDVSGFLQHHQGCAQVIRDSGLATEIMTSSTQPGTLPLESGTDLLILLLYTPGHTKKEGEPIEGITRLQKLMFLLRQGLGPGKMVDMAKMYGYRPYKMGPYSNELGRELDELAAAGIIRAERLHYWIQDDGDEEVEHEPEVDVPGRKKRRVESFRYSLTQGLGMQIGYDLWTGLTIADRRDISKFKAFFNALSLRQLLIFAYERFPDFTTESVIKSKLGLDE